ncbi:hypothetical protein [Streptomyces sasae]|nr:hypothetical protein [Streptomyces sasae]
MHHLAAGSTTDPALRQLPFRDRRLKGEGVHAAVLGVAHLHNLLQAA